MNAPDVPGAGRLRAFVIRLRLFFWVLAGLFGMWDTEPTEILSAGVALSWGLWVPFSRSMERHPENYRAMLDLGRWLHVDPVLFWSGAVFLTGAVQLALLLGCFLVLRDQAALYRWTRVRKWFTCHVAGLWAFIFLMLALGDWHFGFVVMYPALVLSQFWVLYRLSSVTHR